MEKYIVHVEPDGSTEWHNEKMELHRVGGPAVDRKGLNGFLVWYSNGVQHREDGPAIVFNQPGNFEWKRNGVRHREDGPAVESPIGDSYYLNGVYFTREEFLKQTTKPREFTMLEIANSLGVSVENLRIKP
jgi:hypothetical protein